MLDSSFTAIAGGAIPQAGDSDWKIFAVLTIVAILALGPKALEAWIAFKKKGSEDPSCATSGTGCPAYEKRIKDLEEKSTGTATALNSLAMQVTTQLGSHRVEMRDLISKELGHMRDEQRQERSELENRLVHRISEIIKLGG